MEKIAFIFPGLGSQFVGMGKSFYDSFEVVRQTYEEAGDFAGFDIADLCFQGTGLEQNRIDKMQFIVVTTGVAIARAFLYQYGVSPQFCAGHSVGEYAALVCSGAVKFCDVIKILKVRGELLKRAAELGQMTIVEKMEAERAGKILQSNKDLQVYISCYNSPDQFAISGSENELIEKKLLEENAVVTPIIYSPPIHSPLMEDYSKELYDFLKDVTYYSFRIPIISNVTGAPFSEPSEIPYIMTEQLKRPVQWNNTMLCFEKYGISMVIEMGPKNLLTSFLKDMNPGIKKYCFGIKKDRADINKLFLNDESLQKDKIKFLDRCLGIAVSTPNRNDNLEQFKSGVVDNYKNIKSLSKRIKDNESRASIKDMRSAVQYLIKILQTKKVPEKEQEDWLKQLLDETSSYYNLKEFIN